jgi:ABC-type antimicrobial peptide transport system permease subunit
MYLPFEHAPQGAITLFVRTSGDAAATLAPLTASLKAIEPRLLLTASSTLAEIARESMSTTRLMLRLLGIFGGVALALAAVGVFGVMSYAVRQRTREIGTRMALGATRRDIVWSVLRQGLGITAGGLAIGLAISLVAAQSLNTILYGVSAADPVTLLLAAGTLSVATLAACYVPARRAARVDPARTLATD